MPHFLAHFDEDGRRDATYIMEEKEEDGTLQQYLNDGYIIIDEDTFHLLLGYTDGKEHIYDPETGTFDKVYEPPASQILEQRRVQLLKYTAQYLDAQAQALNYDSCLAACSYIDSGVTRYDDEGKAFREWRSAVWDAAYGLIDETLKTDAQPTYEEYIINLPAFSVSYSV